jgi:hypothetical protein
VDTADRLGGKARLDPPGAPPPGLPGPLDHTGQPPARSTDGRWCPYCGADLSGVPEREEHQDQALFAATGRRLKVGLAVGFVLVWLFVSLYDWLSEPSALDVPGWYSALGGLMLFYLLGLDPVGLWRRRR